MHCDARCDAPREDASRMHRYDVNRVRVPTERYRKNIRTFSREMDVQNDFRYSMVKMETSPASRREKRNIILYDVKRNLNNANRNNSEMKILFSFLKIVLYLRYIFMLKARCVNCSNNT